MQKTAEPSPPVEDVETVEGFYSVAPSQASTMSGTPCNIVVDFIAPPGGKFRSLYGLAGVWDSGQLTSNHIVMRESVFREYIGDTMSPYRGETIQVANGQPLDIVGVVQIGLAMPGLDGLPPTIVDMMICNSLNSDFLMGRRMMDEWDLTIQYKGKTESWIVGNQLVPAKTAKEAIEFNQGLDGVEDVYETQQGKRAVRKFNRLRGPWKHYRWADIAKRWAPETPPFEKINVQSAQTQQGQRIPAPVKTGKPLLSNNPVVHARKPCPTPNIGNGNKSGKTCMRSPNPKVENESGNKPKDILLRAASDVVLKPRSIRKIQVTHPSVPNLPGKQRHHFLVEATDESGTPVNPDESVEVGTLSAVVRLNRGQQAVGNKVSVFMVNNTDQYQTVLAKTVVGRGAVTQERGDLADSLSQVGADQHIQRVYGVNTGGKKEPGQPPPPHRKLTRPF